VWFIAINVLIAPFFQNNIKMEIIAQKLVHVVQTDLVAATEQR
jgi:hypothetical protein